MYEAVDENAKLAAALIEIAKIRYEAFRDRFGRDPEPDEPLLFDPAEDEPKAASAIDRTLQVVSAATICNVDPSVILDFLGMEYAH